MNKDERRAVRLLKLPTKCPVCGSSKVGVADGVFRCKRCGFINTARGPES